MSPQKFQMAVEYAVKYLRALAPRDTGNLEDNAIRYIYEDADTARIYVDEEIAPYMPYTNEPWVSPKWNRKKNPNEAWFDYAAGEIAEELAKRYRGRLNKID